MGISPKRWPRPPAVGVRFSHRRVLFRADHDAEKATLDALDLVAPLLIHVPLPRRHFVHYLGAYSNVVRGKLKARGQV
jgi:hypothetical protein